MIVTADTPSPAEKKVRGPYKPRTAPRKAETKPRAMKPREATVSKLNEFWPDLMRAFNRAKSNNGTLPRNTFYSAEEIKWKYGKPARALFKKYFTAERFFNQRRADVIEQEFRKGNITARQKSMSLGRCIEWQWKLKLAKSIEVHKLCRDWENQATLRLAEHFKTKSIGAI